ncbi:hypothetical protein ARMGADRAFT_1039457 [Armillaria gallica]|uniref:Uncharacterized protein n=1 Tax=Armillaria gallica TaxID=47427 RepID=A0A2H3D1A7_ARMGA|nr:hypothetical protein ARMGADRAFT_1039457 [Armillaria gallica]
MSMCNLVCKAQKLNTAPLAVIHALWTSILLAYSESNTKDLFSVALSAAVLLNLSSTHATLPSVLVAWQQYQSSDIDVDIPHTPSIQVGGFSAQDDGAWLYESRSQQQEPMSGAHYANLAEPNLRVVPLFHLEDSGVKTLWSQSPAGARYLSSKILKSRPFMANLLYGNMRQTDGTKHRHRAKMTYEHPASKVLGHYQDDSTWQDPASKKNPVGPISGTCMKSLFCHSEYCSFSSLSSDPKPIPCTGTLFELENFKVQTLWSRTAPVKQAVDSKSFWMANCAPAVIGL